MYVDLAWKKRFPQKLIPSYNNKRKKQLEALLVPKYSQFSIWSVASGATPKS